MKWIDYKSVPYLKCTFLLVLAIVLMFKPAYAIAPQNMSIAFQFFNQTNGIPINGTHTVTATAYLNPSGGISTMNETDRVDFLNGVGSMLIDDNFTALLINERYWWVWAVAGSAESSPRLPDVPVRQTLWANNASWAANSSFSVSASQSSNSTYAAGINYLDVRNFNFTRVGNITNNATFANQARNATYASGLTCSDIQGATSNLCTLSDTNTGTGIAVAVIGSDTGNSTAPSNLSAYNLTGNGGNVTTSTSGSSVIINIKNVLNGLVNIITSRIEAMTGHFTTINSTEIRTINATINGNLTGQLYGNVTGNISGNATFAATAGVTPWNALSGKPSDCGVGTFATSVGSSLGCGTPTDTNTGTGVAVTIVGGSQGTNFSASTNNSAINFTILNGNVSVSGNVVSFNYTDLNTGADGANQFENAITVIGSDLGNFTSPTNSSATNFTGNDGNLTVINNGNSFIFQLKNIINGLVNIITSRIEALTVHTSFINSTNIVTENVSVTGNFTSFVMQNNLSAIYGNITAANTSVKEYADRVNSTLKFYIDSNVNITMKNYVNTMIGGNESAMYQNITGLNASVVDYVGRANTSMKYYVDNNANKTLTAYISSTAAMLNQTLNTSSDVNFRNATLTNITIGNCITYWNGTCEVKQCPTSTFSVC